MGRGLPSDDVEEESGSTLLRSNDASCPMLLKPTCFEVTYFWITYVSLTSCPLGGSIKYGNSETDLLRIRSANVYPGFRSAHWNRFNLENCTKINSPIAIVSAR